MRTRGLPVIPDWRGLAVSTAVLLVGSACGGDDERRLALYAQPALTASVSAFAGALPGPAPRVEVIADPVAALASSSSGGGLAVALVADLGGCVECFRVDETRGGFVVHGDGALGVGYGLAEVLERAGYRFRHPLAPTAPASLAAPAPDPSWVGVRHVAEKRVRGIHLHTLHPIEAYFTHWADGPLDSARALHQWIVANRGNYVEWVALADITRDGERAAAWRARTRQLVDDAHARGLRVGIAVELYLASDLQKGFNLIDGDPATIGDPTPFVEARLALLAGLGFDVVNVSFGEFSAFDPAAFLRHLNAAARAISARLGAEVAATIHVGGRPSQRVTYMGEELPYYFLVKYADPAIVPWVHTVMYYDLFEDAGGAYDMNDFALHRQFVIDRRAARKRVVYYPETAYWIAFDDSVPLYLPLYVRSRFEDLRSLRAATAAAGAPDLDEHVQFSTGFEWGYWQQDRLTLRMGYELPASPGAALATLFPPALAADVSALADLQHDALLRDRLAAYFAGRDAYIDAGSMAGIVAAPDRPSLATVAGYGAGARGDFTARVLAPLGAFSVALDGAAAAIARDAAASDPDEQEVVDGAAIDAARARFVHALYAAAVARGAGSDTATPAASARAALAAAEPIVARRHAHVAPLYRDDGVPNATIYPFGYLAQADTLCYWRRELVELDNLLTGGKALPPGCIF